MLVDKNNADEIMKKNGLLWSWREPYLGCSPTRGQSIREQHFEPL